MAAEPVYPAREIISAANEGNKSRGNDLFGVRSSADTVKGGNKCSKGRSVNFSDQVVVYSIPYEVRKSPWMEMALDRYRFERRIREFFKMDIIVYVVNVLCLLFLRLIICC